jgi:hypothetical protein
MIVYFQFFSLGVLWLMARELIPDRPLMSLLLCLFIVGGFWGQYILDINAWSEEAALPLLLTVLLMVIRLFGHQQFALDRSSSALPVFALVVIGAFYFYPEATMFYLPGIAVGLGVGFWKRRRNVAIVPLIATVAVAVVLLFAVKENNLDFLRVQAGAAVSDLDWWKFSTFVFSVATVFPRFRVRT